MGNFSDLPSEIVINIFTRLPTETVLDCKSVSKTWRKVLQYPSFTQLHSEILLRSLNSSGSGSVSDCGGKFSFIFNTDEDLCYLEYDEHDSSHKVKKLNLNLPFMIYGIVGSCNGLICMDGLPNHYTIEQSRYKVSYICNPITRQLVTLPALDRSIYRLVGFMVCGFGYIASTNEYKVVRLYTFSQYALQEEHEHKYDYKYAQIEVYTLGSGKGWRNAGKINRETYPIGGGGAAFSDGFLFWNTEKQGRIVAFDLANEIVVEFVVEFDEPWIGIFRDGVLGGHIYTTIYDEDRRIRDVWLLKKKEDESFRWSKEFSLINMERFTTPLALTSSGIVLCYSNMKLYLYDLKSSSSQVLEDFGRIVYNVVPHMNSLVSLVAFGEENTKALESGECAFEEAKVRDWKMKQP